MWSRDGDRIVVERAFPDCVVPEIARTAGHLPLATFDKALARLPGGRRLQAFTERRQGLAAACFNPLMETLMTGDGLRLHLRRWPAPAGAAAPGTVQIVHGLGEHIGRYDALAAVLNSAGWNVAGHDQRGHGLSEGQRGAIQGPHALLADLSAATDHLRGRGRHVLLGHSLGGLVAARFVAETLRGEARRWARDVDGLVLSSPALATRLSRGRRLLASALTRLAPNLSMNNGLQPDWISRDADVVRRYAADPLVHDRVTPRLVRFIVEQQAVVQGRAARWRTPTLLLWAGADRCVDPAGSAAFAGATPYAALQAHAFPALAHEIFNEPEHAEVEAWMLQWLQQFAGARGS